MNPQQAMMIQLRTADDLGESIERVYDRVTNRAHEIVRERGAIGTVDVEDWLMAEQQLLLKPKVRIEETNSRVTVTIWISEAGLLDVDIVVTPDAMLIQAASSVTPKTIFRTVEFPRRISVSKAEAKFVNGCLILTV